MKKREKSPAFQLYPKDLLTDTAWLSNEEFGVYVRLLLYAWIGLPGCAQGELPTSVEHLLRLTQLSEQDWERISTNLLPFFTQNGNGKMSQKRLMYELRKQVENRKNKQRAGLASATARQQKANRESTARSRSVPTEVPTESNSSSSSATPVLKEENPPTPLRGNGAATQPTRREMQVQEVFRYWQERLDHPQALLGPKRKRAIEARLKAGYTVDQLKAAIDGCVLTPHNMGQNDRHEKFDDIELICRDEAHVDRFIENAKPREAEKRPFVF